MRFIGIDPGASGGIAVLGDHGHLVDLERMPGTARNLANILKRHDVATTQIAVENVHSMPGQGVASSFAFGKSLGRIEGVIEALSFPYFLVTPGEWQRRMECLTAGDKNISKTRAQQLFPNIKITHAVADALLIAAFCRLTTIRLQSVRKPKP